MLCRDVLLRTGTHPEEHNTQFSSRIDSAKAGPHRSHAAALFEIPTASCNNNKKMFASPDLSCKYKSRTAAPRSNDLGSRRSKISYISLENAAPSGIRGSSCHSNQTASVLLKMRSGGSTQKRWSKREEALMLMILCWMRLEYITSVGALNHVSPSSLPH